MTHHHRGTPGRESTGHQRRPADHRDRRSSHRELGSRERRAVGRRRQGHRQAQPALVDLRRIPRIHRLAALGNRRRAAAGRRLHLRHQSDVLAHLDAGPGRRDPAVAVHVPRAEGRWSQLDDDLGGPAVDPGDRTRLRGGQPRDPVRHHAVHRRARGLRWRQLRQLDVEHQLLLPAAREGLGARPQRGRRKPRASRSPRSSFRSPSHSARSAPAARSTCRSPAGSGFR